METSTAMNDLVKSNLSQIQTIMKECGVINAHLFGSAARNMMTDSSDIDFVVRFSPDLSYTEYGNRYFKKQ